MRLSPDQHLQAHLEAEYLRLFHEPWQPRFVAGYRQNGFAPGCLGPDDPCFDRDRAHAKDRERVTESLDKARRALLALRELRDELAGRWMPKGDPENDDLDFGPALELGLDRLDDLFRKVPRWVVADVNEREWRQEKGTPRGEIVRMMASRTPREIAIVTLLCGERPNRIDPHDPEVTVRAEIENVRKALRRMRERAARPATEHHDEAQDDERDNP